VVGSVTLAVAAAVVAGLVVVTTAVLPELAVTAEEVVLLLALAEEVVVLLLVEVVVVTAVLPESPHADSSKPNKDNTSINNIGLFRGFLYFNIGQTPFTYDFCLDCATTYNLLQDGFIRY
jgi:hypothetical protein